MIFKPWLRYKTSKALKNKGKKTSPGYKTAGHIGVLFFFDGQEKLEAADRLVALLRQDGKEVKVLACERRKTIRHLPYDSFSPEDFSFWGRAGHKGINDFIETEFDYLICLDKVPNLLEKYIIAGSRARCRVGYYEPENEPAFDMLVAPGNNGQDWVQALYQYLKQLS